MSNPPDSNPPPAAPLIVTGATAADAPVALSPDAALVIMPDGNGCVLDMDGEFYAISAIGAEMLRIALSDGPDAAAAAIAASYKADPAQVRRDVDTLLVDMEGRGILRRKGASPPRRRGRLGAGLAAALARGLMRIFRGPRTRATVALAIARVSFGLFGWNATVGAWKKRLPQPAGPGPSDGTDALTTQIDEVVRAKAARMWLDVDCKERALSCLALARLSGLPAELVIGVEFYPLGGHAWCEIGGRTVSDDPGNIKRYMPVFRYG